MPPVPSDRSPAARSARPDERVLAGRYRLVERIDEGGAGEVWRAQDERLGREVAVKIIGQTADDAFRERFADEARRAASVVHPNVVTVFDEGRDGTDTFMVMEYVKGKTLRDIVAQRGPLPPHEAGRLVAQIAAALDAAHQAGVIHCDVKPANVIVDALGTAKLADFGIARAARGAREHELIGTARYIAPERIEGTPPSERSDVYSLGLVAYELLAGRPAYAEMETEELLRHRLEDSPPSLRSARMGLSAELDTVVTRALARDPRERYASAGQFAGDFRAAVERGEATAVIENIPRRLARSAPRWRVDSTVALLVIILILVGTLALYASFPRGAAAPNATPSAGASVATTTAPNVVGRSLADATSALIAAGFGRVAWDVDSSLRGPACSVGRQQPAAGTTFRRGDPAMLWYVAGKDCTKRD
jgi:eukaryotic-like serine/threonine-protein kinase